MTPNDLPIREPDRIRQVCARGASRCQALFLVFARRAMASGFRVSRAESGRGARRARSSFGFPLPSLKFRTVGFPQYGFKWTVSGDLRRNPEA